MDNNNALKIRAILRIVCCICAAGAVITAFIYRVLLKTKAEEITGLCMISRICAIAMFAIAVIAVILAVMSKTFVPKIDGSALVIALVGFIGNFIVAPGSTVNGIIAFELKHVNWSTMTFNGTQLEVGAYMIMLSGILMISYTAKQMKSGN